jgi:O-antigen ligase
LYLLFGYGIFYTFFLYFMGANVNISGFFLSTSQIVFFLLIHVTIKRMDLTYKEYYGILNVLAAGVLLNSLIVILDFYVFHVGSRIAGMADNTNYTAVQMCFIAFYFEYLLIRNKLRLNLRSLLYILGVAYLFFGILATGSRTGLIIFVVNSALLFIFFSGWSVRLKLIPATAVALAILLSVPAIREIALEASTFNRMKAAEQDVRIPLWKAGINALTDTYFMGVGMAQIVYNKKNFKKYMMPVNPEIAKMVDSRKTKAMGLHSLYMELLAETGVISLFLFLLYMYYLFRYQIRMFRKSFRRDEHMLIIVLLVSGLLMGITGKGLLSALFWFLFTFAGIYFRENDPVRLQHMRNLVNEADADRP